MKVIKALSTAGVMALVLLTSSGFTNEVSPAHENSAVETVSVSGGVLK